MFGRTDVLLHPKRSEQKPQIDHKSEVINFTPIEFASSAGEVLVNRAATAFVCFTIDSAFDTHLSCQDLPLIIQ